VFPQEHYRLLWSWETGDSSGEEMLFYDCLRDPRKYTAQEENSIEARNRESGTLDPVVIFEGISDSLQGVNFSGRQIHYCSTTIIFSSKYPFVITEPK
jgi:hypothetical protein